MNQLLKKTFLEREIMALTLAATSQRSNLYASNLTDSQRKPFQKSFRSTLHEMARKYKKPVSEAEHIDNIKELVKKLSNAHPDLLASGRMKFGHGQKSLNLYLKYLWCLNLISEPPHFPIDLIILKKIPTFNSFRWTRMENEDEYKIIISAARTEASKKSLSLAQWELKEYKRRDT